MGMSAVAYQSLHGAVQNISVVAAELWVGSLEGRVTGSLGLLDTVARDKSISKDCCILDQALSHCFLHQRQMIAGLRSGVEGIREVEGFRTYPFR